MTRDIAGICEQRITGEPVYRVEDGGVWISGMNANPQEQAHRVIGALESCGYKVGQRVNEDGGIYIQVPAAESIEEMQGQL